MLAIPKLESKQPRMIGTLNQVPQDFPAELLSKIIGSERVAKSVTQQGLVEKCNAVPTQYELEDATDGDIAGRTLLYNGSYVLIRYTLDGANEWSLTREGNRFVLSYEHIQEKEWKGDYSIVQYATYDYATAYKKKGCNGDQSVVAMLQDLARRTQAVNEQNIGEVSAWVVQLSYQCDITESRVFTMSELGDELQDLIQVMINAYQKLV
jgi:hypothetical protein